MTAPKACVLCSAPTRSRHAKYCAVCGPKVSAEAASAYLHRRWAEWRAAGLDPTHGGEATEKRAAAIAESNRAKPRKVKR